jgi:hypothetical protein
MTNMYVVGYLIAKVWAQKGTFELEWEKAVVKLEANKPELESRECEVWPTLVRDYNIAL